MILYPAFPPPYMVRQYPPVNPALFSQSAATAQTLMNDASTILKKLAESKSFATSVMAAAQEGKTKEVSRMIQSLGIKSKVDLYFNPDGIRLTLSPPPGAFLCCQLVIGLRWNTFPPT
ncbi:hypothetical protein ABET52_18265 [Saccharococcus caldoxylosilyticus]|uniref:YuzC protein n=3 Tax=Bacillales TaxID=1385 RepID=A0A023DF99_9BACL|nr:MULTISPECIES: hypothetical protein [Parageobacillus]KYD12136.1 hypothetical protein B4119_3316 [Parageobacillus caldoxylosilyticus]MBB3852226.1 hypothetical protein [Parageobacillus caldoxylosilyticus]QXJ39027.1 hypothetical protein BV455_02373 [Parageobacillus caldoxylosilyticus]BDG37283.1 hypothetical protein PcaKH15_31890 [Parageobacillus caldoxylosilyticus]BDG41074.1 hypothetical protein PcaKH16_32130 [Parageobacillus caldoxylosilyticus]